MKHKQINLILRSRADVLMSLLTSHLMQESGRRNWKSQKTISQKKAKAKLAKKSQILELEHLAEKIPKLVYLFHSNEFEIDQKSKYFIFTVVFLAFS